MFDNEDIGSCVCLVLEDDVRVGEEVVVVDAAALTVCFPILNLLAVSRSFANHALLLDFSSKDTSVSAEIHEDMKK